MFDYVGFFLSHSLMICFRLKTKILKLNELVANLVQMIFKCQLIFEWTFWIFCEQNVRFNIQVQLQFRSKMENSQQIDLESELISASRQGNVEVVKRILESSGADIEKVISKLQSLKKFNFVKYLTWFELAIIHGIELYCIIIFLYLRLHQTTVPKLFSFWYCSQVFKSTAKTFSRRIIHKISISFYHDISIS